MRSWLFLHGVEPSAWYGGFEGKASWVRRAAGKGNPTSAYCRVWQRTSEPPQACRSTWLSAGPKLSCNSQAWAKLGLCSSRWARVLWSAWWKLRYRRPNLRFAELQVLRMWSFHLRSLEIVTPRYLTVSADGMFMELITKNRRGFTLFLEITSRVLLVGLIARPEDWIQEETRSTSCWSVMLSLLRCKCSVEKNVVRI